MNLTTETTNEKPLTVLPFKHDLLAQPAARNYKLKESSPAFSKIKITKQTHRKKDLKLLA